MKKIFFLEYVEMQHFSIIGNKKLSENFTMKYALL